ncbi:DEAD/DEAH box helicase [Deltaproteobacteria bacterium TL4]
MLPSLLAHEIQQGLKQFLITGFEPSDPLFSGIMRRFTEDESRWLKGPYVQVGLPFREGQAGNKFFAHFETEHPGFTHQEAAWQRLSSDHEAANTLVATGTGSGKTECFLYPVLEHCARALGEGQAGIKALVIYPMNALANDQALRFAQVIAKTPAFNGLRVGLFIGGQKGKTGGGMVMTANSVITDRDTLRKSPPDVLLTNYKMLDYLLIRPKDRHLWDNNAPTTLRYVIVDELHTFDGAQGTDLALLLRRLRARLQTPKDHLICAGTSATLGGGTNSEPLREYARQVFGVPFPPESVITEKRLSEFEFLGSSAIEHVLHPRSDFAEKLDIGRYATQNDALAAWFELFFPGLKAPENVEALTWRAELGGHLKQHLLFHNLLKIMQGKIVAMADLQQQLRGPLPESARQHLREVLDALLSLIAWARDPVVPNRPLVTLKIQLWMRELRRMVTNVSAHPNQIELRASRDLKARQDHLSLPLIQCTDCHTTGWLGCVLEGQNMVRSELDEIYNAWFASQPEVARLYAPLASHPLCEGIPRSLCPSCGSLQSDNVPCLSCGHKELVAVFYVTATSTSTSTTGVTHTWHNRICPACGSRDRQILLGARNATLGAVAIEHTWSSLYNDDKKLIAFSDSVQDAAHRAGFFSARTYGNTVRTGLARIIDLTAKPSCPWPEFLERVEQSWFEKDSPLKMPVER